MTTVVQLPKEKRSAMLRKVNHGMMVGFINADLLSRYPLDVRRSYVFYDEDGLFEYALQELPDGDVLQRMHDETAIRYWSKGVV